MNEIILAYGLGIVSVGLFVLARVVLKSEKQVNEHQLSLKELQQNHERSIEAVYRHIDTVERSTGREFEDVHRKIDSRIDKLEFKMKDQLNFIKNKTSQAY